MENLMRCIKYIRHTNVVVVFHISCKKSCLSGYGDKHPHYLFIPSLFKTPTALWSIGAVSCTLLLDLSATPKQAHQLLLIVSNVPLHDVHAGTQQSLKGFDIHH